MIYRDKHELSLFIANVEVDFELQFKKVSGCTHEPPLSTFMRHKQ